MFADDAPWLVPMQSPQRLRLTLRRAVLVEPPQRAQIRHDELASQDPRRGRGDREESALRVDSSFLASAEEERRLSAET